jgi:hypothetical protein
MKVPAGAIHATLWLLPWQEETATVAAWNHPRDGIEWHTVDHRRRIQRQLGAAIGHRRQKGQVAHGLVPPSSYGCCHAGSQPRRKRRRRRYCHVKTTDSLDEDCVVWRVPRGGGGSAMGLSSSAVHTVYQAVWRRSTVAQCVAVYWMIQGWRSSIDSVRFWRRNGDLQLSHHHLAAWAGGVIGYVYICIHRYIPCKCSDTLVAGFCKQATFRRCRLRLTMRELRF